MSRISIDLASDPADLDWVGTVLERLTAVAAQAGLQGLPAMLLPSAVVEAINNIIEHAYGNRGGGPIHLRIDHDAAALTVELRDRGAPMPLPLPSGDLPDDAADSGRGWRIIRSVFPRVIYQREDGENRLTLVLPISGGAATV